MRRPRRTPMAAAIALNSTLTLVLGGGLSAPVFADDVGKAVSPEAAVYVETQLYELQGRLDSRPPIATLADYGISKDNDLYEGNASHGRVPPSVGFASQTKAAGKGSADPALVLGTTTALRAELNREPTPEEVGLRVAQFDARIALVNAQLVEQREALAQAHAKAGRTPMRSVVSWAEPVMRPDVVPGPYAAENAAVSDAQRRDGDWEIAKALLELLAADRGAK